MNAIGSTARSADGPAADPVDAAVFRRVIGNFASGVVVITTSVGGRRSGATVSAVSSLSLDPPMLLACLHSASSTQEAVREAGVFAVNVLAEDQAALAALFARPIRRNRQVRRRFGARGPHRCARARRHARHHRVPRAGGGAGWDAPGVPLQGRARRGDGGISARVFPRHHGQARNAPGRRGLRRDPPAGADPKPRAGRGAGRAGARRTARHVGLRGLLRPHPAGRRGPDRARPRARARRPTAVRRRVRRRARRQAGHRVRRRGAHRRPADGGPARPIRGAWPRRPVHTSWTAGSPMWNRSSRPMPSSTPIPIRTSGIDALLSGVRATQPAGHDVSGAQQRSGGRSADRRRSPAARRCVPTRRSRRRQANHHGAQRAREDRRSGRASRVAGGTV